MILIVKYFRQILLTTLLMISFQNGIFSQEAVSVEREKPGLFVGISFGPAQTQIINTATSSITGLLAGKKISAFGTAEIGYFFSKNIGLSTGIGFSSYSSLVTLGTYQNNVSSVDTENETYELRVNASGIEEEQKTGFLTIPFCINLRLPFSSSVGFFLQPGISLAVPLSKTYHSSGTFTYKGYYSAYNVLLENLPAYGFPTELRSSSNGDLELNPLNFNAIVSAGLDFTIKNKIQIGIGACYDRSLTSISKYGSADSFHLSSEVDKINSLMGGASKTVTQSIGAKISFRYFLNAKKTETLPVNPVN
jgi:hypothetical protein